MKNLLNLKGAQKLDKLEQQSIKGGVFSAKPFCCEWCPDGTCNGWVDDPRTPCPFAATCD